MQKLLKFGILLCVLLTLSAYGTKEINPLGSFFGAQDDSDPLKLGANPTFPAKQKNTHSHRGTRACPTNSCRPFATPYSRLIRG